MTGLMMAMLGVVPVWSPFALVGFLTVAHYVQQGRDGGAAATVVEVEPATDGHA